MEGDNDIMRFSKNQKWCDTEYSRGNEKILYRPEGEHIMRVGGNSRKLRWLCLTVFTSLWYGKLDASQRMQKGELNIWGSKYSSWGKLEGLPEVIIHTFRTKLICLVLSSYSAKVSSQVLGQRRNITGLILFLCLIDLEIVLWKDLITGIWDPWKTKIL